jgi:23S rRNA (cytosine1962-C5)-methyltransferase
LFFLDKNINNLYSFCMKNNKISYEYSLIDSGHGKKLEQFGPYRLDRPAAQAAWTPCLSEKEWKDAHSSFTRENALKWQEKAPLPQEWMIEVSNIKFKLSATDFGHLGIFPEQKDFWLWIQETLKSAKELSKKPLNILNLFAYSGGSTLAAALAGAQVCHLDASKGMVSWAKENAVLNGLKEAPIRWIIDDARKFLKREIRRGTKYDAIILDPPTFGRGSSGEVFKIEEDLIPLLADCRALLSDDPLFVLLSCHTPGHSPTVLNHLLSQATRGLKGTIDCGEMFLKGEPQVLPLPSGTFARWKSER